MLSNAHLRADRCSRLQMAVLLLQRVIGSLGLLLLCSALLFSARRQSRTFNQEENAPISLSLTSLHCTERLPWVFCWGPGLRYGTACWQ